MNLRTCKYTLIGIIKCAYADFSKGRFLCFYSIFNYICFPGHIKYATAIQIRRNAIKTAERQGAEKHLLFQIQGVKNLTIPQNKIATSAIYSAKNKFRRIFGFSMDAFHFSTPLFHRLIYTATEKYKINLLADSILFLAQNRRCHRCLL